MIHALCFPTTGAILYHLGFQEETLTRARLGGVSGKTRVATGVRPGGTPWMATMARSPCAMSASERGMGVAVMYSTCGGGFAFAASRARCSTPNLGVSMPHNPSSAQPGAHACAQPGSKGLAGCGTSTSWLSLASLCRTRPEDSVHAVLM